jgi:multidrug transporter EmrE-like cation transporter
MYLYILTKFYKMFSHNISLGILIVSALLLIVSFVLFSTADAFTDLTVAYILLSIGILGVCGGGYCLYTCEPINTPVPTNSLGF